MFKRREVGSVKFQEERMGKLSTGCRKVPFGRAGIGRGSDGQPFLRSRNDLYVSHGIKRLVCEEREVLEIERGMKCKIECFMLPANISHVAADSFEIMKSPTFHSFQGPLCQIRLLLLCSLTRTILPRPNLPSL